MFGALADGKTEVTNFLQGADCLSTIHCFRQMGIEIERKEDYGRISIKGNGIYGLREPKDALDVGNSGTTMRLLSGILAGQNFPVVLTGDDSIQKRPMGRIMTPLTMMGADIKSQRNNERAPLLINSSQSTSKLHGIHCLSPVASAQIKSCVLLAGLYAEGNFRDRTCPF